MLSRRGLLRAGIAAAAAPVVVGAAAPAARAELFNPRQQWLRDATAGLFLHWGMRTAPGYTDVAAWEAAASAWTPEYWLDEAQKLYASYVVLACLHSRLGYARCWPSAIPGSPASQRDFLGELVAAAGRRGMHVILYITDDPQHHNETGFEYLDVAAYQRYTNDPTVDITTRDGFGRFSYDNFVEVMQRYPDLGGFWIDNDNAYWERTGLYARIRAERPSFLLSNNNEDTAIMDTVSNEQKTGMTPPYDYPQGIWTPGPRLTEADFKLAGNWWYDGRDHTIDYGLSIGRIITCAGASMKALIAEGAQVDGRFPPNYEAFNNFVAGYLAPIRESFQDTEGGGYLYGGLQPGAFNDGGYGTTTIRKGDPDLHYVHVLTPPDSDTLRVRDNGYVVRSFEDVRTGTSFPFRQAAGYLIVSGIGAWDPYDTVFRVRTAGRSGLFTGPVTASATSARGGFPASNLVDGSYLTWWDNNGVLPVSITLDLGRRTRVRYLAINQREWSPVHPRDTNESSARIRDFQVSGDGAGDRDSDGLVRIGTMENARAVRFIDLGSWSTRFIRLDVLSTWSTGLPRTKYTDRLQIDQMWVGTDYV